MQRVLARAAAALSLVVTLGGGVAMAQDKPTQVDGPTEMERNMVRMWSRENIDETGYTYFSFGADHTIYWAPAEGAGKRVFVRNEYFENQQGAKPYRASKTLYDVDCTGMKWRKLATDTYQFNGMRGEAAHADSADAAWETPAAGSDDAYLLGGICK